MATTIATFHARNDDGKTTQIDVVRFFDGFDEVNQEKFTYCAESKDLGMGHSFKNDDARKIAKELAGRHGYDLYTPEFSYEDRVRELEAEGCTRSDAQAIADAELNPHWKPPMKKATTYEAFKNSRKHVDDLSDFFPDFCDATEAVHGYSYLDNSFYIYSQFEADAVTPELMNVEHVVVIGCGEYNFGDDIDAAEKYLWDNFAMLETNHGLRFVTFGWDDEVSYDGYTDGSRWNGWDNVMVTEKVHKQLCEDYDAMLPLADQEELKRLLALPQSEDRDEAINDLNSFHLIEQDMYRLYDYGNCYTTQIDEDYLS